MSLSSLSEQFLIEVEHLTSEIAALLNENSAQADVITRLGETARLHSDDLKTAYRDGAIWGGSGSVIDVQLRDRAADAAKCRLSVQLVERFEHEGYLYEPASQMAAIYRGWLKSGVLEASSAKPAPVDVPRGFELVRRHLSRKRRP
jgi:hypothetical protein